MTGQERGAADALWQGDPVLDRVAFDRATGGDEGLGREVLTLFREQLVGSGTDRAALHRLKGTCLSVGATALARLCAMLEARPEDDEAPAAFAALRRETLCHVDTLLAALLPP